MASASWRASRRRDAAREHRERRPPARPPRPELQVTVTTAANVSGTSPVDDVWVDTLAPSLSLLSPAGLCGSFNQSATTVLEDVAYTADYGLVVINVTNNGVTTSNDTPAFAIGGIAAFSRGRVHRGAERADRDRERPSRQRDRARALHRDHRHSAGGDLHDPDRGCDPLLGSTGSATGCIDDTDASTPGWQGNLTVHVVASGSNVVGSVITFTNGATTFPTATTDANGDATLTGVTIPEGAQTIAATTDNVPGAGVATGSVAVTGRYVGAERADRFERVDHRSAENLDAVDLDRAERHRRRERHRLPGSVRQGVDRRDEL